MTDGTGGKVSAGGDKREKEQREAVGSLEEDERGRCWGMVLGIFESTRAVSAQVSSSISGS